MAKHVGWRVYKDRGAFVGAAWDPFALPEPRYLSKRHDSATEAKTWAMDRAAEFRTRMESLSKAPTKALADDYIAYLTTIKKRSPSHLANLRRALDGLAIKVPLLTDKRARDQTEAWLASLPVTPRTKVQYLVAAKSLCNWAVKRDRLHKSPLAAAETEKPAEYLKPQFTLAELRIIVRAWQDPYHLRACLMAYAGLRADEAAYMRWEDINLDGRTLVVSLASGANVKRDKERMVLMQTELATILSACKPAQAKGPICWSRDANHRRAFDSFLARIGIDKGQRSPHSLRHSYASLLAACGANLSLVKAFMGHASIAMTDAYSKGMLPYTQEAQHWPRGEFQLLSGWASDYHS